MRTLLIESQPSCGRAVEQRLQAAGHDVVRCFPPGHALFPCAGLAGGCPLEQPAAPVDAVVAVRTPTEPDQTISEMGLTCALRLGVPVLVTGPGNDPFGEQVRRADEPELVTACTSMVSEALEDQLAPLRTEARRLVERSGHDAGSVDVALTRDQDRIRIVVTLPHGADELGELVATRLHGLYQRRAGTHRVIDIEIVHVEEEPS